MAWSDWTGSIFAGGRAGTGFLVGANDLLTNVHVAVNADGTFAEDFVVKFESGRSVQGVSASFMDVRDLWDGGNVSGSNLQYDIALVTLAEPVGADLGWFGIAEGREHHVPVLSVAGYPWGPFGGSELVRDEVSATYNLFRNRIEYDSDKVWSGSSGSPLWYDTPEGPVVTGLHVARDADGRDYAALFSGPTFDEVVTWITANGGASGPGVPAHVEELVLLYNAALDRDGDVDAPGLNFWIDRHEQGLRMFEVAREFLASAEFTGKTGAALDPTAGNYLADAEFVERLYLNILDRAPDPDGAAFWTREVESGLPREQVLYYMATGDENRASSPEIASLLELQPGYWDIV